MFDEQELNARIKRAERTLTFYVLYEKDLLKGYSKGEFEQLIDEQLDVLSEFYKQKSNNTN